MDYVEQLKNLPKKHDFFIGFDSDGCVFDTMEVKHKECFCPNFIKHFKLQAGSKYAREVWEFVNLYSKTRGCNRFFAVKHTLAFMRERKEFSERQIVIPDMNEMQEWIEEETKLGNPALEAEVDETESRELLDLLSWSREVNESIAQIVHGIPPFPGVKKVLEKGCGRADMIVVSQTPVDALTREWRENGIDSYLSLIAGQEYGTKNEHLKYAAFGKYDPGKILMIGDAPGDLKASKANGALFYPIIPGSEEYSWSKLAEEGIENFFNGKYAGAYQDSLLDDFDKALPEEPPWR
ncbi:MAG: HAD family hydrolase [Victivallales bacterium]|nr:HAD family hydrolase [Victivallales bacterium]MCF7889381.1 HAD family hydrolase [Victivallales bacterium]